VAGPTNTKNTYVPPLLVTCLTSPTLGCVASFLDEAEVTGRSSWSAADSLELSSGPAVTASDAVVFRTPGIPTALSARNVYIRADYTSPRYGHVHAIAGHAYAIAPGEAAVPLAYISGQVFEGVPGVGTPAVPNAAVAIVAGEGAGRSETTGASGGYRIEFLRLGQPFTIRASKAGYSTDTREHPGVVDDPQGHPSNTSISFTIQPVR